MKRFSLKEYLENPNKKIVTESGGQCKDYLH